MIEKLIPLIHQEQRRLAEQAMRYPATTDHMLFAGQWQGLQLALELIDHVLLDDEQREANNLIGK